MKKYIIFLLFFLVMSLQTYANPIAKFVKGYDLGRNSLSGIYVKDVDTNEVIYEKNSNKLHNPASTLKALVVGASYLELGDEYQFETALYKDKNDVYIKLGMDVLLTQSDLNKLFADFKKQYPEFKINNVYVDSSLIQNTGYPNTWLEEDKWPVQREITPFVIDGNYFEIALKRSSLATKVDIVQNDDYKLPIINKLTLGDSNNYSIKRPYGEDSSIILIEGTISHDEILKLPILKPEINFDIKLKNAISKNKFVYTKEIFKKAVPITAQKVSLIQRNIKEISKKTLSTSDNLASELIFRVAAAKYINYAHSATFSDAVDMFNHIYSDVLSENAKIADGSGISHSNFLTCEDLCNCLLKLYKESDFETLLAQPTNGTLANRLLFLQDNLKAKTGTLSHASALLGTLTTRQNRNLVFCIITHNSTKRKAIIKNFENRLVGLIYRRY